MLSKATFLANAPRMFEGVFEGTLSSFSVFYLGGKTGFTSPMWEGYPAVEITLADPVASLAFETTRFGESVSVNDNLTAVGNTAGQAVHLYAPHTEKLLGKLVPADGARDGFGESVSLSETHAVVGAPSETAGRAYLFHLGSGEEVHVWAPEDREMSDQFGHAVGVSGDLVVVGAYGQGEGRGCGDGCAGRQAGLCLALGRERWRGARGRWRWRCDGAAFVGGGCGWLP